jgi:hypothetical protein
MTGAKGCRSSARRILEAVNAMRLAKVRRMRRHYQSVMTRFDESHPAPLREYVRFAELQLRYCERMLSGDRTAGAEVDVLVPEIDRLWSSYIECKDRPASYSLQ